MFLSPSLLTLTALGLLPSGWSFVSIIGKALSPSNSCSLSDMKHQPRSIVCVGSHHELLEGAENKQDREDDDSSSLLLRVGVLADIQYAPIPDGYSFTGTPRFYQHSLEVARHAAQHFQREKVDLMLNLGDIVDGKCQDIALNGGLPLDEDNQKPVGEQCVEHVMEALSHYQHGDIVHSYGNHCLYNMDRPTLQSKLGIPFVQEEPHGDLVGYHSYSVPNASNKARGNVRFVVLDSYDICLMGRCKQTSLKRQTAIKILQTRNPNFHTQANSPEGLEGVDRRFVGFNGAVGVRQLQWLRNTLQEAREACETVIVVSHQPLLPESTSPTCLVWNYHQVLQVLREYADVVAASFSGHAHKGGYCRDKESGIHFRVFEAALENPHPNKTYAIVNVKEDRLEVEGFGNCESAVYKLDHQHSMAASAPVGR